MKRKVKFGKNKSVSYGYVGRWRDGKLGWVLPDHLSFNSNVPRNRNYVQDSDKLTYCKITVEQVKNKKGTEIVRTYKTLKG